VTSETDSHPISRKATLYSSTFIINFLGKQVSNFRQTKPEAIRQKLHVLGYDYRNTGPEFDALSTNDTTN